MQSRMGVGFIILVAIAALTAHDIPCRAGERLPGKYRGVVIFDRWDACVLYSGTYLMYVSEKTKEGLRAHAGSDVRIDAKEVWQPINPGDGRIGAFTYLGRAPEPPDAERLKCLRLTTAFRADKRGRAMATLAVHNTGDEPIELDRAELAFTLLAKYPEPRPTWTVSDGASRALITRFNLDTGTNDPGWKDRIHKIGDGPHYWRIVPENQLPRYFYVAGHSARRVYVELDLPDGEYDLLCGYGGGAHGTRCLAGNLSAFDVVGGKAKPVAVEGR